MAEKIRWGILGGGNIANKFAADLRLVKEAELVAIGSRDEQRAKEFAALYGIPNVYNTYEELVKSAVDVIYVATPHGFHHKHVMLCLNAKKAVLCEKAFALNSHQALEMIRTARENRVFIMEAFWSKFLPQYKKVIELLNSGAIGEVKWLQADFGFRAPDPAPQRLYDPLLGGGALLDIGIYPVFLAQSLLGKPEKIAASMTPYTTGVDEQCCMTLTHPGGAISSLSCTFAVDTPIQAVIAGTLGRIEMHNRFHNPSSTVYLISGKGGKPEEQEVYREDGYGYQFEAQHVTDCLLEGLTESPVMTHQDTLELMETLDAIRKVCGIRYDVDEIERSA
jgi:predicted dehydrogenase